MSRPEEGFCFPPGAGLGLFWKCHAPVSEARRNEPPTEILGVEIKKVKAISWVLSWLCKDLDARNFD